MSPAGYWPQLHAAVEAGADSVYFGLKHFTARAKVGFSLAELEEVMRTLHRRGVRGFVTFNTLIFDHEIEEAARSLARIAESGADAIIVQDPAVLALAREIAPDLELHASTQMSITDARGARLAAEMGAQRVTLARELSLSGIQAIREQVDVELEVFVHGALCVAYSGQCFSSEAWGGRSANRGQCAQACRLPYELVVDGVVKPLGDARYLLSPGDLFALRQVPELVEIGVAALKIEGRYKEADYVAAATEAYRNAVDEAWAGRSAPVTDAEALRLEQVYSRGLGPYFLTGANHQAVVRGRAPRHRGVWMGRVVKPSEGGVIVEPGAANRISPLKPGDGLVFDASDWRSPQEPEEGGRLFEIVPLREGRCELRFGRGAIDWRRIRPGDMVWRTNDPAVDKSLRVFTNAAAPVRKQAVAATVIAVAGGPLELTLTLVEDPGTSVRVFGQEPLPPARNQGVTSEMIRQHLERMGNTPYLLTHVDLKTSGEPFVAASLMNQLRREAVEALAARQSEPRPISVHSYLDAVRRLQPRAKAPATREGAQLHLLVRTPEQLAAAIGARPASLTLDYLDLYGLKPSVDLVRQSGLTVRVASPRVLKPGEEKIAAHLARFECPILVRPAGLVCALRESSEAELVGDFSLNAANAISANLLLGMGLTRITPAHDLNAAQVAELAREVGPGRIEAIVYQHLPVFHTEHCVFCRFLSTGTSYRDCGRPCETHRVELRDTNGRSHPVMADVGCRNTVFGAEAQEAGAHLDSWRETGIRHFRIEFAHESGEQVTVIAAAFRACLDGEISVRQLQETLRRTSPQGTTQGSLFVSPDYLALPILQ